MPEPPPQINNNPQLQTYYNSLESRLGYALFLNNTRHFGYYETPTRWPFPLSRALRCMEDKLATRLGLPAGARLLDAGCGVGHVALRLAGKHGYRVQAIDVTHHHVEKAKRNVAAAGLPEGLVGVRQMDYHHLESLEAGSFDGVYTMETLVHATDPKAVLAGFHRLLRPGGRIVLFEYDHDPFSSSPAELTASLRKINKYSAMPTNDASQPGVFKELLEEAGFTDVEVEDYSEQIVPMTRFFYLVGYVPWLFIRLFHVEKHFINTVAGVEAYRGRGKWRYVAVSAIKPGRPIETSKVEQGHVSSKC